MSTPILQLQNISKRFGSAQVLRGLSLEAAAGEFITLLGASGCGKTTTLRIIAGLESPDEGRVLLEGRDVTDLPPERRDVNTVFQSYALFPHMTVAGNIGYGLRLKGLPKADIRRTVEEALALLQLAGYGERRPEQLSGGQRQRVAIARAVVNRPRVLLLDEPLGALDLQLRRQMQLELKQLQQQLGITFIYITHDQEEALTMSDRIAVMRDGCFVQVGTPAQVYDRPATSYVARFVGSANVLQGHVTAAGGGQLTLSVAGHTARVQAGGRPYAPGEPIALALRSEQVEFAPEGGGIPAVVRETSFAGGMLRIGLELPDGSRLTASRHGIDLGLQPGDRLSVGWAATAAVPVEVDDR
ncbi:MAG: ABC transporter ATP-binding protein [Oscillospiraceae bacterium]|nr:ABC transporter ATP-binding protein [Oscillospiraceae bacterium]